MAGAAEQQWQMPLMARADQATKSCADGYSKPAAKHPGCDLSSADWPADKVPDSKHTKPWGFRIWKPYEDPPIKDSNREFHKWKPYEDSTIKDSNKSEPGEMQKLHSDMAELKLQFNRTASDLALDMECMSAEMQKMKVQHSLEVHAVQASQASYKAKLEDYQVTVAEGNASCRHVTALLDKEAAKTTELQAMLTELQGSIDKQVTALLEKETAKTTELQAMLDEQQREIDILKSSLAALNDVSKEPAKQKFGCSAEDLNELLQTAVADLKTSAKRERVKTTRSIGAEVKAQLEASSISGQCKDAEILQRLRSIEQSMQVTSQESQAAAKRSAEESLRQYKQQAEKRDEKVEQHSTGLEIMLDHLIQTSKERGDKGADSGTSKSAHVDDGFDVKF